MSSKKTIDGLPVREVTPSRAVPIKTVKHAASNVFNAKTAAQPAPAKSTAKPINPKITIKPKSSKPKTAPAAHADFLKPVETFDFDLEEKELKQQAKSAKKSPAALAPTPAAKQKKKPGKIRKIITSFLLVLVLLVIAGVVWVLVWGNDLISKLTGGQSNIWDAISSLTSDTYQDLKTDGKGRTNILIFGTSGYDMSGSVGNGHHDGSQLTDSIMALSLDQTTGDVAMTSIPRDLKVKGACYAGKINEVFICNYKKGTDDAAGAAALQSVVSEVVGLDFQYYAHINWESLRQVVDALGGITVTLDEDINDKNYTGAVFKAGVPYTLKGEEALGLARARHGTAGGDFTRGTSQQKILIGIKDKIVEKLQAKSFGLTDALAIVSALGDNLRTNISINEVKTVFHLAETLNFDQMRQIMLFDYSDRSKSLMTTANINGLSFVVPKAGVGNYTAVHALIAKEFNSDDVVREAARILILNGTGESGIAAKEATELKSSNYNVVDTGNAPAGDYAANYAVYLIHPDAARGTSKSLHGLYNVEIQPAADLPSGIPNSDKYDIIIIMGGQKSKSVI